MVKSMKCRVLRTHGMFDGDADEFGCDERVRELATFDELLEFAKGQVLRFADAIAEMRHVSPESELLNLGPEYVGAGFVMDLEHGNGSRLSVGIASDYWVIVTFDQAQLPDNDGGDKGRLVMWFEEWTEWHTLDTYKRETAVGILQKWFKSGVVA